MKEKVLEFETCCIGEPIYHTSNLANRLLKQDIVVMLMLEYISNELCLRTKNKLMVFIDNIQDFDNGDIVTLKCLDQYNQASIILGHAIIDSIDKSEKKIVLSVQDIYVKSKDKNDFTQNVEDLFEFIDFSTIENDTKETQCIMNNCSKAYLNKDEKVKIDYISNMFKYYYDFIFQLFHDNDNYYAIPKITAMSSYLIAKEYFERRGKIVSSPNVFIKGFCAEFDLLLLNKKDDNKYVFDIDEVEAIVELKANGIVGYRQEDKKDPRWFYQYINLNQTNEKYRSKMDQDLLSRIKQLPFYYYCCYEKNISPTYTYINTLYDIYQSKNHKGVYLAITNDSYHYLIPVEYEN